jgi:hypothetical protein
MASHSGCGWTGCRPFQPIRFISSRAVAKTQPGAKFAEPDPTIDVFAVAFFFVAAHHPPPFFCSALLGVERQTTSRLIHDNVFDGKKATFCREDPKALEPCGYLSVTMNNGKK